MASFAKTSYYRLNVFTISLPPLRAHAEDIPALAQHFWHITLLKKNRSVLHINKDALQLVTAISLERKYP